MVTKSYRDTEKMWISFVKFYVVKKPVGTFYRLYYQNFIHFIRRSKLREKCLRKIMTNTKRTFIISPHFDVNAKSSDWKNTKEFFNINQITGWFCYSTTFWRCYLWNRLEFHQCLSNVLRTLFPPIESKKLDHFVIYGWLLNDSFNFFHNK